jgi:hypothetical protein
MNRNNVIRNIARIVTLLAVLAPTMKPLWLLGGDDGV